MPLAGRTVSLFVCMAKQNREGWVGPTRLLHMRRLPFTPNIHGTGCLPQCAVAEERVNRRSPKPTRAPGGSTGKNHWRSESKPITKMRHCISNTHGHVAAGAHERGRERREGERPRSQGEERRRDHGRDDRRDDRRVPLGGINGADPQEVAKREARAAKYGTH